jgi:hypothetical protein
MAWHAGQSCEEYDKEMSDALAKYEQEEARRLAKVEEAKKAEAESKLKEARKAEAAKKKALEDATKLKLKHIQDNNASATTVKKISRACPNKKCRAPIQKASGCDHMTCKSQSPIRSPANRSRYAMPYYVQLGDRSPIWKC